MCISIDVDWYVYKTTALIQIQGRIIEDRMRNVNAVILRSQFAIQRWIHEYVMSGVCSYYRYTGHRAILPRVFVVGGCIHHVHINDVQISTYM